MADRAEVAKILSICVRKLGNPRFSFPQFLAFSERYLEHYAEEYPQLKDLQTSTEEKLHGYLGQLEEDGVCALLRDGERISEIVYSQHYITIVDKAYEKLHDRPDLFFPTEESLSLNAPEHVVVPVDITAALMQWLESAEHKPRLLRLIFPENLPSIIITSYLLGRPVILIALQRVRLYFRNETNASYVHSKLQFLFRGREIALRDIINGVLTNPESVLSTVLKPDEFTFYFWAQLSNMLVKEFQKKKDRLPEEEAVLQAAYLIGYHAVFYKGLKQKSRDLELAQKLLEKHLHHHPYTYSISEIYGFGDDKGVPITKNLPPERIQAYLAEQTAQTAGETLPEIIRTRTHENQDYYLRKEYVIAVVGSGIHQASEELRRLIVQHWTALLRQDNKMRAMSDDEAFERFIETNVKARYPITVSLLNPSLLLLAERETSEGGQNTRAVLNRVVNRRTHELRPLAEALQLDRKQLYQDARLMLPFWQVVPGLAGVVRLLKRFLFAGSGKRDARRKPKISDSAMVLTGDPESHSTAGEPEHLPPGDDGSEQAGKTSPQSVHYRKAIRNLKREFLGASGDIDAALQELVELWNPLLDRTAKHNLVEDVNALVRDFLRRMRVLNRNMPPDKSRIHSLAERLSRNDAFKEIKRKRDFQRYLELYMLKILSRGR